MRTKNSTTANAIPDSARRRRPWFEILRELIKAGVPYAAVARKCNRDVSTVCNWANGGDPKDSDARVVMALYARHCPERFAEHEREFGVGAIGVDDGAAR